MSLSTGLIVYTVEQNLLLFGGNTKSSILGSAVVSSLSTGLLFYITVIVVIS